MTNQARPHRERKATRRDQVAAKTNVVAKVSPERRWNGSYRFVNLVPGSYRIEIEQAGFKRYTRSPLDVNVESQVRADIAMEIGAGPNVRTME